MLSKFDQTYTKQFRKNKISVEKKSDHNTELKFKSFDVLWANIKGAFQRLSYLDNRKNISNERIDNLIHSETS